MVPRSSLKIGLILDDSLDKTDGVQQYVLAIGEWFALQGHEVHYLVGQTTRDDKPHIHSLSRNLNVRFNHNRMSMPLPSNRQQLKKLIDDEQFDILHVQLPYSPWLAHRIIDLAGTQTVVFGTFHIVAYSRLVRIATRLLAVWTRKSLRRFDKIVSVSPAAAAYAAATYGLKTSVVPNVVDYDRFSTAKPRSELNDPTIMTLLFLGRLVVRKGCLQLLRAIKLLAQQPNVPKFELLICGKGPLLPSLQKFVTDNKLSGCVRFVGFVSEADKPGYYASANIAVFPSSGGESFGIVLIEAMASGRAVVLAGDNSGYRSVLGSRSELLFDSFDVAKLAQILQNYMTNNIKRTAAVTWGIQYARQFDVDVVGKTLLDDYYQALRNRRRP